MVALQSAAARPLRAPLLRSMLVLLLVLGGLLLASLTGPPPASAVSGQLVWASTFTGLLSGSYDLYAASPGPAGTMYAAGAYGSSGGAGDFLTQRYRTTDFWQTVYSGSGQGTDRFRALAFWGKNAVFAAGLADSGTGQDALATRWVK